MTRTPGLDHTPNPSFAVGSIDAGATVTCDVSATCFGFELKLKPKPGKPKPPKELKPKSLKADLRCVPPS